MVLTNTEKVLTVFQGFANRDLDLMTTYVHPAKYTEHNPRAAMGLNGWRAYLLRLTPQDHLRVVRAFADGPYVVTQAAGQVFDQGVFFHIFRFEDGLIVEQWVFAAPAAPPNQSGHTQTDGPTVARTSEDLAKNKAFVRDYYQTFHIAGDHRASERYFAGDSCIRHEPGVRDGVGEFLRDVQELMRHRTIEQVQLLLGQGDFVFVAATGSHVGNPCFYIDLYRVENEKLAEHWGFFEEVLSPKQQRNNKVGR